MGGGVQFEILKNPGIDFYGGFIKKIQVYTFIVASEKKTQRGGAIRNPKKTVIVASGKPLKGGGGGANLIPKKVGPP